MKFDLRQEQPPRPKRTPERVREMVRRGLAKSLTRSAWGLYDKVNTGDKMSDQIDINNREAGHADGMKAGKHDYERRPGTPKYDEHERHQCERMDANNVDKPLDYDCGCLRPCARIDLSLIHI